MYMPLLGVRSGRAPATNSSTGGVVAGMCKRYTKELARMNTEHIAACGIVLQHQRLQLPVEP
jgi:hypothetical protein